MEASRQVASVTGPHPVIVRASLEPLLETLAPAWAIQLARVDHRLHVALSKVLHRLRVCRRLSAHTVGGIAAVRQDRLVLLSRAVLVGKRDKEALQGRLCSSRRDLGRHDELGQRDTSVARFGRLEGDTYRGHGRGQVEGVGMGLLGLLLRDGVRGHTVLAQIKHELGLVGAWAHGHTRIELETFDTEVDLALVLRSRVGAQTERHEAAAAAGAECRSIQVLAPEVKAPGLVVVGDDHVQLMSGGRDVMRDVKDAQGRLPNDLLTGRGKCVLRRSQGANDHILDVLGSSGPVLFTVLIRCVVTSLDIKTRVAQSISPVSICNLIRIISVACIPRGEMRVRVCAHANISISILLCNLFVASDKDVQLR